MAIVWMNGRLLEESEASITLRDTGLLHAAGVFTTMRAYAGNVFRLSQHLQRLRKSCTDLFIPLPHKDEELTAATTQVLEQNKLAAARLRWTVTRGIAENDPLHGMRLSPTAFLTATELQPYPIEYYQRGMTAILLDDQKLNPYDLQAGHKTLNYLSRLAALRSANQRGAGEALWFNVHNYLQSGSISNVFLVKQDTLITPPTPADLQDPALAETVPYPRSNVLPGIVRQTILDLADNADIPLKRQAITVDELLDADEVFLTNSIMGVMPICRLERKAIGEDKPGPITVRLSDLYARMVEA